jgi:hypothetical protein
MATFQHKPDPVSGRGHSTKHKGDAAEDEALAFLQNQGLQLVHRRYEEGRLLACLLALLPHLDTERHPWSDHADH